MKVKTQLFKPVIDSVLVFDVLADFHSCVEVVVTQLFGNLVREAQ